MSITKFKKTIAALLLFAQASQVVAAVVPPDNSAHAMPSQQTLQYQDPDKLNNTPFGQNLQNLTLSTNQLGITGPVNAGVNYSDLTGAYFVGQILKKINDQVG